MSRRHSAEKREILPDPKFGDIVVTKFMNSIMYQGKKSIAESDRLRRVRHHRERAKENPLKIFKKALDNVKPALEVRSRRVGGATYQVPVEVRTSAARRWRCAG